MSCPRSSQTRANEKRTPPTLHKRVQHPRVYGWCASRRVLPGELSVAPGPPRLAGVQFQDLDELYWNATGNGWVFPIDVAEAFRDVPGLALLESARPGRNSRWS